MSDAFLPLPERISTMNDNRTTPEEARAALELSGQSRQRLSTIAHCPPWRHAAFGVVMALLIGGVGFELPIQTAALVVAMAGVALIATNDRKRYGVFINGYRRGATRPLTFALLAVMAGLIIAQIWLRERNASTAIHLAIGFAAFLIGTGTSVIWSRTFRRELERRA